MQDFEKLGSFYLGKRYDLAKGETTEDTILYDSKDLTTHAVCVGMTGSGKTGLCLSLLEEAAIDGIPAIAIDPKGDLGNLMLTFPNLLPADFKPWIDESTAARQGLTPEEYAAQTADLWKNGLAKWGQDGERIRRFQDAVETRIYTPGSNAGLPLTVLRSFSAPPQAVIDDADAFRQRVSTAASGILALLGVDADPVRSREHILLSNILDGAWRAGRDLDIAGLIREVQSPAFDKVGVFELETFFPPKDRTDFAMSLNNLLASPSFGNWLEGEPLDIQRLLYSPTGKPRLSILSISHLSDPERMFFVTILLNEILTWMRSQAGTSSLRALLYMDEVYGYFPPTANPPSKIPMLTLLKQARAYGLGVVLSTQNPVDLDYKGLSNAGTWLLGRLQTERDKARVLEGLEGASIAAGSTFNRSEMEATLAAMGSRVFLMNNVHEDQPVTFHTRWALSYLRGPMTRNQIKDLMDPIKEGQAAVAPAPAAKAAPVPAESIVATPTKPEDPPPQRDLPPHGTEEYFAEPVKAARENERVVYRPGLLCTVRVHYVKSTYDVDHWSQISWLVPIGSEDKIAVWEDSEIVVFDDLDLDRNPAEGAAFATLPSSFGKTTGYTRSGSDLKKYIYRDLPLKILQAEVLDEYSLPEEREDEFRVRLRQVAFEKRDIAVEKMRKAFASKAASLESKISTAKERLEKEEEQYSQQKMSTAISFGKSILGALFGRKLASRTNVTSAGSSIGNLTKTASERSDVKRAAEKIEQLKEELAEMESEFEEELETVKQEFEVAELDLEELEIAPRKSDLDVERVALVWLPWRVDKDGIAEPNF
ncbi:MAG: hypothetical protein ACI9G1_000097 [Pirellulaceae bacterium]|jgi:hypothetical protein